ncbi:DUF3310 domain-containing protein [Vagococcus vulneris]|uniref:DUF3310 domain-containing protein n=1 Tax=Vagococcus vulneris TaxID=1977869 RepID=A0A429ZTJ3_9ENTE|nr:DUF3310 domain-containing protein [Vagococcus vulneris]RST96959.1 hypothetical protein CBF37_10405 [Vagococcus vulneris]
MKIYHTKTQADYDALMEELENKGYLWDYVHIKNHPKLGTYIVTSEKFKTYNVYFYTPEMAKERFPGIPIIEYTAATQDNVNSPKHYNRGKFETIDVIKDSLTPEEYEGFLKGNMIKYVIREREKGGTVDIEKNCWYANELVKFREGK